jgi:hypothetical protein
MMLKWKILLRLTLWKIRRELSFPILLFKDILWQDVGINFRN